MTAWIPSEDEWYKAAYYNGGTSTYSLYPTQSNTAPTVAAADASGNISNPGANVVNYLNGADWNGQNGNLTTVGSAGEASASFYGTFDQGGNVRTYPSTSQTDPRGAASGSLREGRGGHGGGYADWCRVAFRYSYNQSNYYLNMGFRPARSSVP